MDNQEATDFYIDKPKIFLPTELKPIYELYQNSPEINNLLSEDGRTLFPESITTNRDTFLNVETLQYLSIKELVKNYKGGKIDDRIQLDNLKLFGEFCNVDLPLIDLLDLECEYFWQRVVETKSKNSSKIWRTKQSLWSNWKKIGIELKLAEIIENKNPKDQIDELFIKLIEKCSKHVKELNISSLRPLETFEHKYLDEKLATVSSEVCHHISFEFLGKLSNLYSLSVEFVTKNVARNYKMEKFKSSYLDFKRLGSGIKSLCSLKVLKIRNSQMDNNKMDTLITGLNDCVQLEEIDFSNCNLQGDCMITIGLYLKKNNSLTSIELQGNQIDSHGVRCLAYGLQNCKHSIKYLGLARNPIGHEGIEDLGAGLSKGVQLHEINLNSCNVGPIGAYRISHILQLKNTAIVKMNISSIEFSKKAADTLVEALQLNLSLTKLDCRNCGLSEKQEMKIKLLIERNKFYKQNPCLKKETFTKQDEVEIDKWLMRMKHPILLEVEGTKQKTKPAVLPSPASHLFQEVKDRVCLSTDEIFVSLHEKLATDELVDEKIAEEKSVGFHSSFHSLEEKEQ